MQPGARLLVRGRGQRVWCRRLQEAQPGVGEQPAPQRAGALPPERSNKRLDRLRRDAVGLEQIDRRIERPPRGDGRRRQRGRCCGRCSGAEVGHSARWRRNRWAPVSNLRHRPGAGELDHFKVLGTLLDACVERGAAAQELADADSRLSRLQQTELGEMAGLSVAPRWRSSATGEICDLSNCRMRSLKGASGLSPARIR